FLDSTCTTPLTTTGSVASGDSTNVCVKVDVPASAADGATSTATVTATSVGSSAVSASGTVTTKAVAVDTLVVDDDSFSTTPVDVQKYYTDALAAAGKSFQVWDLESDKNLPLNFLKSFKYVVWFTGNSYPSPLGPYESELKSYLDGGGNLFVSGQDLLDQSGGTTSFVHDYLHVTWDGLETQNDKATKHVTGVAGTLTNGVGTVAYSNAVLGNDFEDEITPNGTAQVIFTDDSAQPDALQFSGTYKVVFLAFPFEGYGTATQRTDLITRVLIVEDHRVVAEGLAALINDQADMSVVGNVGTVAECVAAATELNPDVVLLDFRLPDGMGPDAAAAIRSIRPASKMIFLTREDTEAARFAAVQSAASAFLPQS